MKLSIIIPTYNERKTVAEVIRRVKKVKFPIKREIIVVDDGSIDNSYELLRKIKGIKLLGHNKNQGKGAAIRTALKHVTGDIVIIQDSDLELHPKQIPRLIKPILSGKAEVVYGSRNKGKKRKFTIFYIGGMLVTFVTNLLYGTNLSDEPCGYKVFLTDIIKNLKIDNNRFEWEPEITAKIAKKGIEIYEVPVDATSRTIAEGKKLRYFDGLKAIWTLIKYKF